MGIQTQAAAANLWYEFDWASVIPTGVTLVSVVHSVPAELTLVDQSTDVPEITSAVKVSGGAHGGLYIVRGVAALSNGDSLPYDFPLRVFG